MLTARVLSEGVRASYPSCLQGLYISEEVRDFTSAKDTEPITAEIVDEPTAKPVDVLPAEIITEIKKFTDVDHMVKYCKKAKNDLSASQLKLMTAKFLERKAEIEKEIDNA
jgi:hypothetical protein